MVKLKNKTIVLGYMDSCFDKRMKPLSAQVLNDLMNRDSVISLMHQIEAEPDAEKKSQLKNQLPVVLYACQMPANGIRPTAANALPSGLCLHDWDGMSVNPRQFYLQQIAGKEQQLHIVLAHVTPRGQGLRLVTELQAGQSIEQCQEQLAAQFGMQQFADRKIKDLSRVSFLPSKDYLLYLNETALFQRTCPEEIQKEETQEATSPVTVAQPMNVADDFSYQGVKYSAIIQALMNRIATQGTPRTGERNDDLFLLVRELRHICDYNFQTLYLLVAPYFPGLQDAEIRRTISSALATNGRNMTPVMQGVLNELHNQDVSESDVAQDKKQPKLPKLSDVEEMIISHYPKHLRSQVFKAMLPIWGIYGTHIRFDHLDGMESSLSFMTAVVGKSGSGKAFATHLYGLMTKRFQQEDTLERQKANRYLAAYNKSADNQEKPDDPRPRVHLYGDDITTSQLLDYLNNLEGEHGLQFTEEVARLVKAKRTVYGDNDDLYCKSFDNGWAGKESKSRLTQNIRLKVYLNTLFCGTYDSMHKFYNNPEGGLNNRIIFAFMPNVKLKKFPHYFPLNPAEQEQFDQVTERLWNAGKDDEKVVLPWLEKAICMLKNKWDKEDDENPDDVWYDLGKRSLAVGMRVGVLQWYLRNCPTDVKQLREIVKVVKWIAEAMRQGVYDFSGQDYEKINEADNAYLEKQSRNTKNKKLFSLLPDTFTIQDLIAQRIKNGDSQNVRMVLSRWVNQGLIQKVGEGRYRKLPQLVA